MKRTKTDGWNRPTAEIESLVIVDSLNRHDIRLYDELEGTCNRQNSAHRIG